MTVHLIASMKAPVVLLTALVLLVPPGHGMIVRHPDYGVVTSVQFFEGTSLQRLRELGVGHVRVGIGWNLIEPTQGQYNFHEIQIWLDNAHAAGLHIYASLGDPPAWAVPCGSCMPNDLHDW